MLTLYDYDTSSSYAQRTGSNVRLAEGECAVNSKFLGFRIRWETYALLSAAFR